MWVKSEGRKEREGGAIDWQQGGRTGEQRSGHYVKRFWSYTAWRPRGERGKRQAWLPPNR